MSSKDSLRALLENARLLGRAKERAIAAFAALAFVCAWAFAAGVIGRFLGFFVAAWLMRAGLLVLAAAGVWAWLHRARLPSTRISRILALSAPGLHSAVSTAAELVGWQATRKAPATPSMSLADAHVEQTTRALASSHVDRRIARFYAPALTRARRAAIAAALLLALGVALWPSGYGALLQAVFDAQDAEVSDVPLVGDLSLTLRFPAYTSLPPHESRGGDGTIRALKGTSVLFRATAEKSVRTAELHIGEDRATQRVIPLAVARGRELTGEFLLERSERYRVVLKPLFGSDKKERRGHAIIADEDKIPTIDIREPAQDMELKDTGRMLISYSADDDFAVSEIALEYHVGAQKPQRITFAPPAQKTRIRGDYAFDLSPLQLKPGDVITLALEAKDNDTVSGPKIGRSRERRISVFSWEQQRRQLLQRLRQIVDKMVDQLADELENPLRQDPEAYTQRALPADERGLALASELADIARGLKENEGGQDKFALSSERTSNDLRLGYTQKKLLDAALQKARGNSAQTQSKQAEVIALLERSVIYFEDLRALAVLEEMKAQAKELQLAQAELKQLLEQYKQSGDENLKKAFEAEIAALKQKINEMMQKMAELRRGLPQEFMNREALERRAMENIFDRMDQMLAENRLDDLSAELERLQAQMQNFENSMNRAEEEYGGERYSELRKSLQDFGANLDAVEAAQKDVYERTKEAEQKYRAAAQKELGQKLDELVKQSLKDLDEAQRSFDKIAGRDERSASVLERARSRALDARNALEQRDFMEARDMAQAAQQEARELAQTLRALQQMEQMAGQKSTQSEPIAKSAKDAQERIDSVASRLNKLFPDPRDVLSTKELAQLDELRKRQQEIAQRAQRLGQQMRDINKQAPIFDDQAQQQMDGAKGAMERAGQELGQQQAGRAMSSQSSALSQLQKTKEAMRQRQGQGGGQGMPMPMGGMPSPFGEGFDPRNQDKVEIPSGDAFKVPPEFRRDILDAMKQGTPEKFKQQVNEFYKELIK